MRGHHAITAVGALICAVAAVHHGLELRTMPPIGPAFALLLDGGIGLGVIYNAKRVRSAGFSADEERRIALWAAAGGLLAIGTFAVSIAVRAVEGRPLTEPVFPLLIAAGVGTLGGTIAGQQATERAAEARRARDAKQAVSFLNHLLRHDLRNDLTAILGYANLEATDREGTTGGEETTDRDAAADREETTDTGADTDEATADYDPLTVIRDSAQAGLTRLETMNAVTNALFDTHLTTQVDLAAIAREVTPQIASRQHVTLETTIPEHAPVAANEGVRSILDNLLTNATEHATDETTVHLEIRDEPERDRVVLTIRDDGPGVGSELRRALATAEDGGLFIVRRLIDAYDGSVSVEESSLGGVQFVIRLPRAKPQADG